MKVYLISGLISGNTVENRLLKTLRALLSRNDFGLVVASISSLIGQDNKTTKMAGRVERRINDKFYFVLDEVGGSSDCETEITSDIRATSTGGHNAVDDKEAHGTKSSSSLNDFREGSPKVEESILQSSDALDEDNGELDKNDGNCLVSSKSKFPQRSKVNFYSEQTSVVDMDIDSDLESSEPKIKPLFKVTFRDEAVEKRFKPSLFKFMSQKLENGAIITNSENSLEIEVYDKDPRNLLNDDLLDFNLDTTPGDSHVNVPNYGKSHDLLLSDKSVEEKQTNGKLHAATMSCFNCLGNHVLRDCPQAKDFRTINKNRWKFQNQKEKTPKTSRYHLDENQKFSHLTPGVISKKLRNALNLRREQQPRFIYRMRHLGYPPAWLEEAKVCHSGVTMYDDTGVPVLEEDEEEGEIIPEGAKDKFDITKIIEFPGFNVPLPSSFKDETKYYECPAYSEEHSKENLIKLLEPKTVQAYVKKSLVNQKSEGKSTPETQLKRAASPTIEEMEEKKRQLLMELNGEDADSKTPLEDATPTAQTPTSESVPENKRVGTVMNSEFGTPVLKSVSPFSKLPTREQFSCNVSDVINFENLPNSTGKYESMREVISKIRTSTSKIQKE